MTITICTIFSSRILAYGIEDENPLKVRGTGVMLLSKVILIVRRMINVNDEDILKNQPRNRVITS